MKVKDFIRYMNNQDQEEEIRITLNIGNLGVIFDRPCDKEKDIKIDFTDVETREGD